MSDMGVRAEASRAADDRWRNTLALAAAIILGIAAVLTAWSAYRESLTSDGVLKGYAEQQVLIAEANDTYGRSDAERSLEEQFYLTFAVEAATGNDTAVAYLQATMGEQLRNAVQWWVDQPEPSPLSPFVEENPYFAELPSQQLVVAGDDLMADASAKRVEAEALAAKQREDEERSIAEAELEAAVEKAGGEKAAREKMSESTIRSAARSRKVADLYKGILY